MRGITYAAVVLATLPVWGCSKDTSSTDAAAYEATRLQAEAAARAAAQMDAYKACVQSVMNADAEIRATGASVQAATMREIDTTACPADFRQVYELHIQAWEDTARVEAAQARLNNDENVNATIIASMIAGVFGTGDTPIRDHLQAEDELKRLRSVASERIRETYNQVKVAAVGYGATLPNS